ncbi:MAG: DUF2116 family Zn-ribbon domain-containing protein [Agriterribacter sp.]
MPDAIQPPHCMQCGKPLKGRIDKKFCDDWCRNAYNNKRYSNLNNVVKNINSILKKNRLILEKLIPDGKGIAKAPRKKLSEQGFNFEYITHTYTTQKGQIYFFCYEYGYLHLEHDFCLVVSRQKSDEAS